MNKVTCIIVDDEREAREGLSLMIEQLEDIELLETCRNGIEAIEKINEFKPDLVLLDIQMPNIDGFEVLKHSAHKPAAVIFITGYDQYALKAFEVHAVDYLLKPFNDDRFYEAIKKAKERIQYTKDRINYNALINDSLKKHEKNTVFYDKGSSGDEERIVVKVDGNIHVIPCTEILWIEAYDYYIKIHLEGKYYLVRETMKNILNKLPQQDFMRIHKSAIVNTNNFKRIENTSGNEPILVLDSGQQLKVSRTFKKDLLERFKAL